MWKNRTLTTMAWHINSGGTPILFMLFCWTLVRWRTIDTRVSPIDHIESIFQQQVGPLSEVEYADGIGICLLHFRMSIKRTASFTENVLLNATASNTFRSVKYTHSAPQHTHTFGGGKWRALKPLTYTHLALVHVRLRRLDTGYYVEAALTMPEKLHT